MYEYIELGSAPVNESCVQVSKTEDYLPAMRKECNRWKEILEKTFPNAPGYFSVKSFQHDFGTYCEVVYHYDPEDVWAYFIEGNAPLTWDDDLVFETTQRYSPLESFIRASGLRLD